jgi:hypothetical protein
MFDFDKGNYKILHDEEDEISIKNSFISGQREDRFTCLHFFFLIKYKYFEQELNNKFDWKYQ